jgi:hypothetical protein
MVYMCLLMFAALLHNAHAAALASMTIQSAACSINVILPCICASPFQACHFSSSGTQPTAAAAAWLTLTSRRSNNSQGRTSL